MTDSTPTIAIIGGGPRGISILERLAADYRQLDPSKTPNHLDIHVVDEVQPGEGKVWRTDQTTTLCMNTLADAVTLFTEPGATVTAPVLEGPTMHEWIMLIRGEELGSERDPGGKKTDLFTRLSLSVEGEREPLTSDNDGVQAAQRLSAGAAEAGESAPTVGTGWSLAEYAAEIAETRPESHPSRALYGEYLRWVFSVVLGLLPEGISVHQHLARATEIEEAPGDSATGAGTGAGDAEGQPTRDRITLDNGTTILADATVLAIGWADTTPDALESFTASAVDMHPALTWVRPGNPADQQISQIPSWEESQEEVLVRGLGMGFFDLMAMLTIDRGGRFIPDTEARSGLRYEPSGREPKLVVTSHHGYPYQPKPVFGSLPPAAWLPRFKAAVAQLDLAQIPANSLVFGETLWPAILRDSQEAYYRVLLAAEPDVLKKVGEIIDDPDTDPWRLHEDTRLDGLVAEENRFDLPYHADPVARFAEQAGEAGQSIDELTARIADGLAADLSEAQSARESAVKMGLQVIGSARKPAAVVDEPGRFTTESRRGAYAELKRVGQMVGSGPPAFRTAELLCLVDAGYVRFLGSHPTMVIDPETPAFVMTSPVTREEPVESRTLVDAWLHKPDVRSTADPLSQQLKDAGRMRIWLRGDGTASRAPEVELATSRLIREGGQVDPRVHMVGIPLQDMRADMTISPMPRTDTLMLQETDGAAVSVLRVVTEKR